MKAAAFEPYNEPITVNVTIEDYLADLKEIQDYRRETFMESDPGDTDTMLKNAKKLQQTLRAAAGAALQIVSRDPEDSEMVYEASELLTACKNDAALVEYVLKQQFKEAKAAEVLDKNKTDRLCDALEDALVVVFRLRSTEDAMNRAESRGEARTQRLLDHWAEVAAIARRRRACVPQGHTYYPCRPYPPVPTPPGETVPDRPAAFDAFKELPPEDLEYDSEHDEFFIPEGYVSADGRLDHDSIQFDWEHDTVTCKFIGEEPVTWNFYKVRTPDFQPEGWAKEYQIRYEERIRKEEGL